MGKALETSGAYHAAALRGTCNWRCSTREAMATLGGAGVDETEYFTEIMYSIIDRYFN